MRLAPVALTRFHAGFCVLALLSLLACDDDSSAPDHDAGDIDTDAASGPRDASAEQDAEQVNDDPFLCGGAYRYPCAAGKYCAFSDGCGTVGYCRPRDGYCDRPEPVCGCDGQSHASQCAAALLGVGVAHPGSCPPAEQQFACGRFTCDTGSYCFDVREDRSDPDQEPFVCVAPPAGCSGCACAEQLGKGCYLGADCRVEADHVLVTCRATLRLDGGL